MPRHLLLRLEAPLVAFGDVMIDGIGPVRATPAASLLTGLLGNALGYYRWEGDRLARIQQRLIFGCRLDRRGTRLTDFQTAQLGAGDVGWTTRGRVEGRAGGAATYLSPHIRHRDYDADTCVTIALRLLDAGDRPTIDDLAHALDEPARPLFLGRKPCLPASRLLLGVIDAPTVFDTLLAAPLATAGEMVKRGRTDPMMLVVLPADDPCPDGFRSARSTERRDWVAGVHSGEVLTFHGHVSREQIVPGTLEAA